MKRILMSHGTGLGNAVLLNMLITNLLRIYPAAEFYCIGKFIYGEDDLLKDHKQIHVININSLKELFWFLIKSKKFDLILCPFMTSYLLKTYFLAKILKKGRTIIRHQNIKEPWVVKLLDILTDIICKSTKVPINILKHEIFNHMNLIQDIINHENFIFETIIPNPILPQILTDKKYIVIQPSTTNGNQSVKQWPQHKWVEFLRLFQKKYPKIYIVIVGDKNEIAYNEILVNKLATQNNIINLTGSTTIKELIGVIKNALLLIVPDSSVAHIAGILHKETVLLWGPTILHKSHPIGSPNKIHLIMKLFYCQPCSGYGLLSDTQAYKKCPNVCCMNAIQVKEVLNKVNEILNCELSSKI